MAQAARNGGTGGLPPLTGVPIPIKDLNRWPGCGSTLGSAVFADNVADEDDYVVVKLREAGT